jgi:hypothetical protein
MLCRIIANCAGQLTRICLSLSRPPPTATGSLNTVTSVEALALPVLLQGHDRTLSGAALVLTAWEEGHDTRPLRGVPSELRRILDLHQAERADSWRGQTITVEVDQTVSPGELFGDYDLVAYLEQTCAHGDTAG